MLSKEAYIIIHRPCIISIFWGDSREIEFLEFLCSQDTNLQRYNKQRVHLCVKSHVLCTQCILHHASPYLKHLVPMKSGSSGRRLANLPPTQQNGLKNKYSNDTIPKPLHVIWVIWLHNYVAQYDMTPFKKKCIRVHLLYALISDSFCIFLQIIDLNMMRWNILIEAKSMWKERLFTIVCPFKYYNL